MNTTPKTAPLSATTMLYQIDYEYGTAELWSPISTIQGATQRFWSLASECFGIRKSIGYVQVLPPDPFPIPEPFSQLPGAFEMLRYSGGDVIVWNEQGEKICSEFQDVHELLAGNETTALKEELTTLRAQLAEKDEQLTQQGHQMARLEGIASCCNLMQPLLDYAEDNQLPRNGLKGENLSDAFLNHLCEMKQQLAAAQKGRDELERLLPYLFNVTVVQQRQNSGDAVERSALSRDSISGIACIARNAKTPQFEAMLEEARKWASHENHEPKSD